MMLQKIRTVFHRSGENNGKVESLPSNGKARVSVSQTFRSWRAFIINHPRLIFDYSDVRFSPSTPVPRDAQFIMGNQPVVILIHCDESKLPSAKGTIPKLEQRISLTKRIVNLIRRRKTQKEILSGFKFLTTEFVYAGGYSSDPDDVSLRFESNTRGFIEAVGGGKLWQTPEQMGPWEFGSHLALNPLKRQLTKRRHTALAKQLDATVKWMIGALIIAIVFAILFIRQGS